MAPSNGCLATYRVLGDGVDVDDDMAYDVQAVVLRSVRMTRG